MSTKNILVTGGAGFIGSNFIRYVLNHYNDCVIINYDKLTYAGNLANLEDVLTDFPDRYFFVKGDIADSSQVQQALEKYNVTRIVNFAAESHVDRSILDASPFLQTNVIGTHTLLETAQQFGIQRFLQVSTDEVYGSLKEGDFACDTSPLNPSNPYAASKAAGDMFVISYWKTFNLPILITRSSNNYGPYQFPEKFIPLMISNSIENKKLPIYGKGENIRDWIFVEDNCEAISQVLWNGQLGKIYNIGGDNQWRNIDVITLILELLCKPKNLITYVKDRIGHDFRYAMDYSHIINDVGWKPSTDFREGLQKTISWYQNNPEWIKNVKNKEYMEYYSRQYNR